MRQRVIGLTGPTASGKSEAAKIIKSFGAHIIDADKIGHYVANNSWRQIVKSFGRGILLPGRRINRPKLGRIIFNNARAREQLNSITHPKINREIKKKLKSPSASLGTSKKAKLKVINAALFQELKLASLVDEVWVVVASKEKRLRRLKAQELSEERALARMRAQKPISQYLKMADVVIENNSTLKALKQKILKHLNS